MEIHKKKGVRDYLPLQQGLRRAACEASGSAASGQRLSSITTRIKTDIKM